MKAEFKKLALFMSTPMDTETKTKISKYWKFGIGEKVSPIQFIVGLVLFILGFGGAVVSVAVIVIGCSENNPPEQQTPPPVQVEQQQTTSEVPTIKIVNNRLFVDDKEMLAKEFVEKYCFAKRDNQTCVEAVILNRMQARRAGGAKPTGW